ncbi:NUDIX domain-containing protein [Streptococcus gordonii]|uniref:NUDIX domain-containing protein n=1 Tax=Streptococcus gordonii TaxID=1302 RepID=UPI001CC025E1|nr:NUDIX domain-containing protein [Streptococcus gordonii]
MRAGILIYHPKLKSILTVYRYKNGQHYYVLPGGQIEESESPIEAAISEGRF